MALDSESGSCSAGMDLLSAITHKFGHKLGFHHEDRREVMAPTLFPNIASALMSSPLDRIHRLLEYDYLLMVLVALTTVASFEQVGSILVIA
jgi:hypothetical protein